LKYCVITSRNLSSMILCRAELARLLLLKLGNLQAVDEWVEDNLLFPVDLKYAHCFLMFCIVKIV